jgi:16S rRNA (uracil1498-N3)-methyltransferase
MRLHRFYVNKPLGEEIVVESAGDSFEKEILNQWIRVFRFAEGDQVLLFSSLTPGFDFRYTITSVSKEGARLAFASKEANVPGRDITLVMALVKKDTFETIVRQATELGVSRIIPIIASRSEKKNLNFERLAAISREAAEQCGRGDIPEVDSIMSFDEVIAKTRGNHNIIGSLHGTSFNSPQKEGGTIALWIGPEGGWTEDEEKRAKEEGFSFLKLTDTVLKADTAATAILSLFAIQS